MTDNHSKTDFDTEKLLSYWRSLYPEKTEGKKRKLVGAFLLGEKKIKNKKKRKREKTIWMDKFNLK